MNAIIIGLVIQRNVIKNPEQGDKPQKVYEDQNLEDQAIKIIA